MALDSTRSRGICDVIASSSGDVALTTGKKTQEARNNAATSVFIAACVVADTASAVEMLTSKGRGDFGPGQGTKFELRGGNRSARLVGIRCDNAVAIGLDHLCSFGEELRVELQLKLGKQAPHRRRARGELQRIA